MRYLVIAFVATMLLAGSAYAQEDIVLSSDDPADQAIGEILAQRLNTTLVTTPWGTLSEGAVTKIEESNATRVLVVGGKVAVPDVEETVDMDIKRLAGKDRYHTSALAASLWNSSGEAIVVEGRDEQAIKEALKEARQQGAPLLFAMNDHIPEEVREKLRELKVRKARFIPSPNMNASDIREEMEEEEVEEVQESEVDFEERAREAVKDAEEAVAEAEFNVSNATGPGEMAAANLLTNAREHLKKAESALNQSKYGRAFGLATAAKHEAKAASRIRERIVVGYYKEEVEEAEGLIEKHGLERAREALESARERMEEEEESEEEGEEEVDEMADSLEKKLEILEKREEKLEEAREKVEEAREKVKAGRQENGTPVEEGEGQESEEGEETGKAQEASLHGVGKCDQCHDAPTMSDMAAGEHAEAFQKRPGIHKPLCSQCHDVKTFCTKCHGLPEVMQ